MLTGAIIVASIGSPGWEIREPVRPDRRTSSAVPAGNSCADKGKNNGRIEQERKQNSKAVETIFCSCEDFPIRFYMHYEMFLLMAGVGIRK
jgi:hypothetical protein